MAQNGASSEPIRQDLEVAFEREFESLAFINPLMMFSASPMQWWTVLATIQLACRCEEFDGPTRRIVEDMARQIQARVAPYGALAAVAEAGWLPGAGREVTCD